MDFTWKTHILYTNMFQNNVDTATMKSLALAGLCHHLQASHYNICKVKVFPWIEMLDPPGGNKVLDDV